MWIVQLALRRPYTFVVLSILILILGAFSIFRTPTDIFPNINIPVVSIVWSYTGLNAQDMSDRIVSVTERTLTTTVDNIEHIESQSLNGIAVVKVFFQPSASVRAGHCPGHCRFTNPVAATAARHDSPPRHQLQRVQRAHSAVGPFGRETLRAATQ